MSNLERGLVAAGLTKKYGGRSVVEDVTFRVLAGQVVGFLGPNGAGKTTTLRMVTGLSRPHAGDAYLDGIRVSDVPNPGRAVGVLLDASATHPGRSVRETMRLVTDTMGVPRTRGEEFVEAVGLAPVARRRVGTLSLGMRQRLCLALTLVGEPRHLVLDEPMNGLDTEGISWLKDLLRRFAGEGGGVLISTHLLGEISGLADHVVIIDRGKIVVDAPVEELAERRALVRSGDDAALAAALAREGLTTEPAEMGLLCRTTTEEVGQVALRAGIPIVELRPEESDLASVVLGSTVGEFAARAGGRDHQEVVA